ncbi:MAG: AAA family ATPase [Candidatus Dormibacteraeota bacterium]|uniref:AAA family ATPase n=1 Tax=Candidatus Aeolococcus gillhamiae TaxID=3127015 RepID=A0A934N5C8_9BACT|nr:AAA family ATPase [Candidatus Dormibacteraeota bacterium]
MDPDRSARDEPNHPVPANVPAALGGATPQGAFVGRAREIGLALTVLEDALAGRGRVLLVAGEPGIGKSRLADELAERARERAIQVVWGRCWEAGGAPVYWPWVQSLRSLVRNLSADELRRQMGTGVVHIAQLLLEIHGTVGDLPEAPAMDPEAARFRLFDSIAIYLTRAALARPVMLVLDDLQVADTPSLLLLRFLAGALDESRILLLATYRDTDLTPGLPLTDTLAELGREQGVRRLTLRGLTEVDVAHFISAAAGFDAHESLARLVHGETEGNPLFVQEVTRLLLEEGRLTEGVDELGSKIVIPRSVREVIGRRLKPLSQQSLQVLSLASVLGREFNLGALSRLAERPVNDIIAVLDEPLAAGVISDVPATAGRLRFSHALIRETIYGEIGRARRTQLHELAAISLESLYEGDPVPHLAELAYQFFQGSAGDQATYYARRAAAHAVSLLAYEEAVRLFQMALQGLAMSDAKDPEQRCALLLALGDAQVRAGDEAGSKESYLRAADLGRSEGLGEHLPTAALGYGGRHVWTRAAGDRHVIPLLEAALAAVGDGDSVLRARLLARLAGALRDEPSPEPRESLSRQAVDVARRVGDPATLAYALDGMFGALWRPDNPQERLAIASEIIGVGESAGDPESVLWGHHDRLCVFFELGDIPSVYGELSAFDRVVAELREPALSYLAAAERAALALLEGRFRDAELLISAALQVGQRSRVADALAAHAGQLFHLRREQGRLAEIEEHIVRAAREFHWYPLFRCALALLHCELGQRAQARAEFEEIANRDFAGIPLDNYWVHNMCLLSEVACLLGDDGRAETLYDLLLPYADRNAFGPPEGSVGSVSRVLGLLADVRAHSSDAERHFADGLAHNERMGARPWVAHTQYDFGMLLLKGGGQRERAIELLKSARDTCDDLSMSVLGAKVATELGHLGILASVAPTDGLQTPVADGRLQLEGEYWTVGYEGRVLRLRDSKGMRILARLLAQPGRPHPSLDLERIGAGGDDATARAVASGHAGELIDDEARRAYRARMVELHEAIEDAEAWGKADQAGAMREELEFITHELGRALGLGGRARVAGSTSERARLNVTRAVKSAVQRIATIDPGLAAHLEGTVHTGNVCLYSPDPRLPITWQVGHGDVH